MVCKGCGYQLSEGDKFCKNCGKKVEYTSVGDDQNISETHETKSEQQLYEELLQKARLELKFSEMSLMVRRRISLELIINFLIMEIDPSKSIRYLEIIMENPTMDITQKPLNQIQKNKDFTTATNAYKSLATQYLDPYNQIIHPFVTYDNPIHEDIGRLIFCSSIILAEELINHKDSGLKYFQMYFQSPIPEKHSVIIELTELQNLRLEYYNQR